MEAAIMEEVQSGTIEPALKDCEVKGSDEIVAMIVQKLTEFDKAIAESKILKIDGVAIDGKPCEQVTKESRVKVLNSTLEAAYEVSVDAIIRQPLADLIMALETGLFTRLHGVTRIVGYYSRISNWNSSKIAELRDRRVGTYWEEKRINSERITSIGE